MTYDEAYEALLKTERDARKADREFGEGSPESVGAYKIHMEQRRVWASLWQPHPKSRRRVSNLRGRVPV